MEKKYPSLIDVPVAMVFFSRPDLFAQIFERVRQARPSKLFLIMDGPRKDRQYDVEKIEQCRAIAENVDWECEVYKNYSGENLGCGKRITSGLTWAFSYVDRLIILEDDTLPDLTWFKFASEILEKYKNDERIGLITGVNHLGTYSGDGKSSYFFATCGSIAGWATWKRVWDRNEYDVPYAEDDYYKELIRRCYYPRWQANKRIVLLENLRKMALDSTKRKSWSGPFGFMIWLQSQLIVVPKVNLISNIGIVPGSTNCGESMAIVPKGMRAIFNCKLYEMHFPLIHPKYVIEDRIYNDKLQNVMNGGNNIVFRFIRKIEVGIRILLVRYLKVIR